MNDFLPLSERFAGICNGKRAVESTFNAESRVIGRGSSTNYCRFSRLTSEQEEVPFEQARKLRGIRRDVTDPTDGFMGIRKIQGQGNLQNLGEIIGVHHDSQLRDTLESGIETKALSWSV